MVPGGPLAGRDGASAAWSRPTDGRGQTSIDFLVGIGVFLLATGFVFGFVPGLLAPFADGQSAPLVTDRVADTLVGDVLVDEPGDVRLNETATVGFFVAPPADLPARFGLDDRYHLNVTVERNVPGTPDRERLCTDGAVVTRCEPGATPLAAGEPVPVSHGSVITASRLVHVGGGDAIVVVRAWS